MQQVRTYISRCTSTRQVQQIRTYSSRYVLTAAGIFSSSIYVRASSVGTCCTYISRCSTHVPNVGAVGTYLICRRRTMYCTAVGTVRARAVGTVLGTGDTLVQQQVHQQVQYVREFSSSRYSNSRFCGYVRDFTVDMGTPSTIWN